MWLVFLDFGGKLLWSYWALAGAVTTIVGILALSPKTGEWLHVKAHPLLWRYGPIVLTAILFIGGAFNIYWNKSIEANTFRADLDALQRSAEGMFIIDSVVMRLDGSNVATKVNLRNSSKNIALRFMPDIIIGAINGIEQLSVPYDVWPLFAPEQTRGATLPEFPKTLFRYSTDRQRFAVRLQGQYGTVNAGPKYPICETHICEFDASKMTDNFQQLSCNLFTCNRDEWPSSPAK